MAWRGLSHAIAYPSHTCPFPGLNPTLGPAPRRRAAPRQTHRQTRKRERKRPSQAPRSVQFPPARSRSQHLKPRANQARVACRPPPRHTDRSSDRSCLVGRRDCAKPPRRAGPTVPPAMPVRRSDWRRAAPTAGRPK
ncbi:hypothetical protein BT67DRAFT_75718 [Trichocladium antarcticum]|uniref:Uncharacterized protein n=1 Tax=Trichocladium antarcticum TaxID=1450529 RepID=A0AAN6UGW7_9PEZI|nr:hypothetical protein BT67DRAFT_75718 [Trichocladium antarcticum]